MSSSSRCRCPVCGAGQVWSDACRRCGADLGWLHRSTEAAEELRVVCLRHLNQGQTVEALACARRLFGLRPDEPNKRLLAVCLLLAGEFGPAAALASHGR